MNAALQNFRDDMAVVFGDIANTLGSELQDSFLDNIQMLGQYL